MEIAQEKEKTWQEIRYIVVFIKTSIVSKWKHQALMDVPIEELTQTGL